MPQGPIEIGSKYYVNRLKLENLCLQIVLQPRCLLRIKAPNQMGKTSLMLKLLADARKEGLKTILLNFDLAGQNIYSDIDRLFKWFSSIVTQELNVENKIDEYWDEDKGSTSSCNNYFSEYLLKQISEPIVLAIDNIDRLFAYREVAEQFLGILRIWHEAAVENDLLKKLRLVLAHSTEVYIPLDYKQSPFNVGEPVGIPEFTTEQTRNLAIACQLKMSDFEIERLREIIGGHPHLTRLTFHYLNHENHTLDEILAFASSDRSIYIDHLKRLLVEIEEPLSLAKAMKKVVESNEPVKLKRRQEFKLMSLGLIKIGKGGIIPSCLLYRQYFQERLIVQ